MFSFDQDISVPRLGYIWFFLAVSLVLGTGVQIDKTIESFQRRQPIRNVLKNSTTAVLWFLACILCYDFYTKLE